MNPFDVSRFGTININFEHLKSIPTGMDPTEFVNSVVGTILDKMGDANVALAVNSPFHLPNMKEICLHDGALAPGVLGITDKAEGVAAIDVNNVFDTFSQAGGVIPTDYAEAVGTVCSHEIGHAYLPRDHSVVESSLMGDGPGISGMLGDGGDSLLFTDQQIQLMNIGIAAQSDPNLLAGWQDSYLQDWELNLGQAPVSLDGSGLAASDGVDGLDAALDPSVWGNFDPSVMGSIGGLGDLDGYGDLAGAFDISNLNAGADGLAELASGIDADAVGEVASGLADGASDLLDGLGEILSAVLG